MEQTSISFDHAADVYDATRALPADVEPCVMDAIAGELRAIFAERALEVGVGTGRIARPLAARGFRICGADIAPRMLQRLREQLGPEHVPPDLLLGDACHLPFASASFPAVLVCHVLHLISEWSRALAEMQRVLAPGGVIIHHTEHEPDRREHFAFHAEWDRLLGERGFVRRSRPEREDFYRGFTEVGGSLRTNVVAEWEEESPLEALLQVTRDRVHSWTWEIPEEIFYDCCPEFERWARANLASVRRRRVVYSLEVWSFD